MGALRKLRASHESIQQAIERNTHAHTRAHRTRARTHTYSGRGRHAQAHTHAHTRTHTRAHIHAHHFGLGFAQLCGSLTVYSERKGKQSESRVQSRVAQQICPICVQSLRGRLRTKLSERE